MSKEMQMQFETATQQQCYEKIAGMLRELYGEQIITSDEYSIFLLHHGSTIASIHVAAWDSDDAVVTTQCRVIAGVELTLPLAHYLLSANARMRFGAYSVEDGATGVTVYFGHTIRATSLELEELKVSIEACIWTADHVDDTLAQLFGGQTYHDSTVAELDSNYVDEAIQLAAKDVGEA
jgi:hypothetical protein